ncbi:hypothetical protein [Pseudoalteromonas phenolica]|uniref:hypothetical protein n=1 Tax=Pseudoalteromonas phenolica TaxID=161398 RepID=UPI0014866F3B|nr:hypothetical protein [Pseudoalteromonas phenolica]
MILTQEFLSLVMGGTGGTDSPEAPERKPREKKAEPELTTSSADPSAPVAVPKP